MSRLDPTLAAALVLLAFSNPAAAQVDSVLAVSRNNESLLRVNANGRVGVGLADPLQRLHVNGTVRADSGVVFGDGSVQVAAANVRAAFSTSNAIFALTSTCQIHSGPDLTITVPSDGLVIVRAYVMLQFDHEQGTADLASLNISEGASPDCDSNYAFVYDPTQPTTVTGQLVNFEKVIPVTAGTHTFRLSGRMVIGASTFDHLQFAQFSALFVGS